MLKDTMEMFRIAQYGLMQAAAIIYGVLSCGTAIKICTRLAEQNLTNSFYDAATFYRNYGAALLLVPLAWAVFCAFRSSEFSGGNFDERWIVTSGWILFFGFAILGSVLAFGTATMIIP